MALKKKKPHFHRQLSHHFKRIGRQDSWRRPRGKDSKQKRKVAARGHRVEIGYKQTASIRGLHPCGMREVLVCNVAMLNGIDSKLYAVRISSAVGKKKRAEIAKKAEEMKLKMLNK